MEQSRQQQMMITKDMQTYTISLDVTKYTYFYSGIPIWQKGDSVRFSEDNVYIFRLSWYLDLQYNIFTPWSEWSFLPVESQIQVPFSAYADK